MKIQIIVGSTRPGRKAEHIAEWVYQSLSALGTAEFELVDIADYDLPLLDEPMPPSRGIYTKDHTRRWADTIARADGYIFVTPEYNHSVPAAMKNAVDYLKREWRDKSVGFVAYGSNGGSRAVEHWRAIVGELHMADVRDALLLYLPADFEDGRLVPTNRHTQQLQKVAEEVVDWAKALSGLRTGKIEAI